MMTLRFMTGPATLAAALGLAASLVSAQQGNPGAHFLENWDLDGDGQVTLAEATERRDDVFASFDADEDGALSGEEHDLFDEARANDMRENGMGQGGGQGKARRKGQGWISAADGMKREYTDADGDGRVTHAEFMAAVPDWFARIDSDGDGAVTASDFPRRGN